MNPFAIWGTLENVTSYEINQVLEQMALLNESNYTIESWASLQSALESVPDSFYESGDNTN